MHHRTLPFNLFLCLAISIGLACSARGEEPERPPSFIVILADDLGYGDIGPFADADRSTPNLDRMAAEGIRFTSFYVTSGLCTPSRASLMTGAYPRRVGLQTSEKGESVLFPGSQRGLHPDEVTIAEALRRQGYATAIIGKWHLGDQPELLPTRQGFDSYFGLPYSNDMGVGAHPERNHPPLPLLRNEEVIEVEPDQSLLTRRYTEEAVRFVRAHSERPFFLYLAHAMPHYPQHASAEFRGRTGRGTYADVVTELDWSVGEILATLRSLGLDRRTLVIFTSDNGAAERFDGTNAPLRGYKGHAFEGGMRVPCLMWWPGTIPAGAATGALATTMDLLPTFARLAGGEPPGDRVLDGKDIAALMTAPAATTPHDRFYYYQRGSLAAVRSGEWKLHVGRHRQRDGDLEWQPALELYDLESDVGERTNLAPARQDVVERLQELIAEGRADLGDDATGQAGTNLRPAGSVPDARPLTRRPDE